MVINSVNKRYVPKLRFKGFEGEYKEIKISDVSKFYKGDGYSKKDIIDNGKYEVILYGDLFTTYKNNIEEIKYKTNRIGNKKTRNNSILFPGSSTSLNDFFPCCSIKKEVFAGSDLNIFELNINEDSLYYSYCFSKPCHLKNIFRLTEGSTINHLYGKYISEYKLIVPDQLIEQEEISSFFNLLDKQISLLENKLKLIEQMKKYYLYKMINIGNKFLIRFNEFKDSSIENAQLTSLVKLNKYKQISASELEQLNSKSGNIKLLPSSKDFDWFSDLVDIKDNRVNYGNVITLGRARYANIKKWKGHFISSNNIIIENNNNVVFDYLYHLINKNKKKFYIEKTTYPVFSSEIFKEFDCSIPSNINEQIKISDFLNKIEWIELHIKNKIELTKKRKSFYLNNLFI